MGDDFWTAGGSPRNNGAPYQGWGQEEARIPMDFEFRALGQQETGEWEGRYPVQMRESRCQLRFQRSRKKKALWKTQPLNLVVECLPILCKAPSSIHSIANTNQSIIPSISPSINQCKKKRALCAQSCVTRWEGGRWSISRRWQHPKNGQRNKRNLSSVRWLQCWRKNLKTARQGQMPGTAEAEVGHWGLAAKFEMIGN